MPIKFLSLFYKLSSISGLQFFQLLRFGALILLSIFLVKNGRDKESIAQYESLLWSVGFVSFFWVNALIQLFLAKYPFWSEAESGKELFKLFLTFQLFATFSAIAILLFWGNIPAALFILFQGPANLNEYVLYLKEKKTQLYVYGLLSFLSYILLVGCCIITNLSLDSILSALVVGAILRWSYTLWLLAKNCTLVFALPSYAFFYAFVFLAIGFLFSGSGEFVNGWLVKHFFDAATFAEFRIGSKELPFFTILTATLSNSFISKIAHNQQQGIAELKSTSLVYMHLLFPLAIILVWISPWAFPTFFSAAYKSSSQLFSILLLLTIPRLLFPQTLMHALQLQKQLMIVSIIEFIITISGSILLIPFLGLKGILIGLVIANLLEKLILVLLLKVNNRIALNEYTPLGWFLCYAFLLIVSIGFIFL